MIYYNTDKNNSLYENRRNNESKEGSFIGNRFTSPPIPQDRITKL
ncbi:hypothetical protein HMPREF9413_5086 [Paenibacillus sp. HGF7]|nr:hypothetical protein HMPREF9413_5086 [Paenibacillus sp. HGF7]